MSDTEQFLSQIPKLEVRMDELNTRFSDPAVLSDVNALKTLGKERAEVDEILTLLRRYEEALNGVKEAQEIIQAGEDPELVEKAKAAAARLGLDYEYRLTGYGELTDFMSRAAGQNED